MSGTLAMGMKAFLVSFRRLKWNTKENRMKKKTRWGHFDTWINLLKKKNVLFDFRLILFDVSYQSNSFFRLKFDAHLIPITQNSFAKKNAGADLNDWKQTVKYFSIDYQLIGNYFKYIPLIYFYVCSVLFIAIHFKSQLKNNVQ